MSEEAPPLRIRSQHCGTATTIYTLRTSEQPDTQVGVLLDSSGDWEGDNHVREAVADHLFEALQHHSESALLDRLTLALNEATLQLAQDRRANTSATSEHHLLSASMLAFYARGRTVSVAGAGLSTAFRLDSRGTLSATPRHTFLQELLSKSEVTREQALESPLRDIPTGGLSLKAPDKVLLNKGFELHWTVPPGATVVACTSRLSRLLARSPAHLPALLDSDFSNSALVALAEEADTAIARHVTSHWGALILS